MTARRTRLRHVDFDSVVAAYESGEQVRALCVQHRIGVTTLYRILDDCHVPRREPDHAQRTPELVQDQIAAAYQRGDTVAAIAKRFGVSKGTVSNVGRRRFGQRMTVRRHGEMVELIVRWLFDGDLSETELDSINRAGVKTRLPGFQSIQHIAPELRGTVAERVAGGVSLRWPGNQ